MNAPARGRRVQPSPAGSMSGSLGRLIRIPALNPLVDLLAVNRHRPGGTDSDSNLVALDPEYRHRYLVANHQRLTNSPGEDEHSFLLGRRVRHPPPPDGSFLVIMLPLFSSG